MKNSTRIRCFFFFILEPHRPVFALTGCKFDLVSNGARREVSQDEAKAFADQNGLFFVETSARTGVNVEEVFNMVTQEVSVLLIFSVQLLVFIRNCNQCKLYSVYARNVLTGGSCVHF